MRPVNQQHVCWPASAHKSAGSGAKAKVRPIPGNSPHGRPVSRDYNPSKRVCDDPFPATGSLLSMDTAAPPYAFSKAWRNLSGPMGSQSQNQSQNLKTKSWGEADPASRRSAPSPGKRTCREDHAPSHRPQMSSGRLFLDRVARQQSPSPLHRYGNHKTLDEKGKTNYHRTVTASFSPCLTLGVHPIYPCAFVCIRG